MHFKT